MPALSPFNGSFTLRHLFRKFTHTDLRAQHLHNAQLELLEAQAAAEYWTAMVGTLQTRVNRLKQEQAVDDAVPQPKLILMGDSLPMRIRRIEDSTPGA